jgi:formylglycine-generating enzyme required for sulfatase activity
MREEAERRDVEVDKNKLDAVRFLPITFIAGAKGSTRTITLLPGDSFRDFDRAPEMVVVPPGAFWMGSREGEGRIAENPKHLVTIPKALAVGKYLISFDEWETPISEAISLGGRAAYESSSLPDDEGWGRGPRPVINVGWGDAQGYISWLNSKVDGQPYRLLSEAEWEYACRADSDSAYCFGDDERMLGAFAWFGANSGNKTHRVGEKQANRFGLYDMHGNVWEWCEDVWNKDYNDKPDELNTCAGPRSDGSNRYCRVLRGASWVSDASRLRSAARLWSISSSRFIGFRVARTIIP